MKKQNRFKINQKQDFSYDRQINKGGIATARW